VGCLFALGFFAWRLLWVLLLAFAVINVAIGDTEAALWDLVLIAAYVVVRMWLARRREHG
jgi:hypothetical protein